MPIIERQRQLVEVGRIRLGTSTPRGQGKIPSKLDHFRFTSVFRDKIEAIAKAYGGGVSEWNEGARKEWQVVVTTDRIPILVTPRAVDQWYELWGQVEKGKPNVCLRRCDGHTCQVAGTEGFEESSCLCAAEDQRSCKPTTRLWVLLPEIPGLDCWRLETRGYYASEHLPATAEFLVAQASAGRYVPASLTLHRSQKVTGKGTFVWYEPVILVDSTPLDVLTGRAGIAIGAAVEGGPPALPPATEPPSVADLDVNADTGEIREAASAPEAGPEPADMFAPEPDSGLMWRVASDFSVVGTARDWLKQQAPPEEDVRRTLATVRDAGSDVQKTLLNAIKKGLTWAEYQAAVEAKTSQAKKETLI